MNAYAKIRVTKDRLPQLAKSLATLADLRVVVGVPTETAERDDGVINNAGLAYLHEHGAPEANIPPRPFLYPTVRDKQDQIAKRLQQAGRYACDMQSDKALMALEALGLEMQAAVRNKIVNGPFVPLAQATLAKRKARGVSRTKPLIDTGNLIASINYAVRGKKSNMDMKVGKRMPWAGTDVAKQGKPTSVTPQKGPPQTVKDTRSP